MAKVFISHNSQDYPYAEQVCGFLRANEFDVFLSEDSLPSLGPEFLKHIAAALDTADHLVVIASTKEKISTPFIENECGVFIHELWAGRKSGGFFSILVEEMLPTDLPLLWRYYEAIPWTGEGKDKLLRFLGREAEKKPDGTSHGEDDGSDDRPRCMVNSLGATFMEVPVPETSAPGSRLYVGATPVSNRHYAAFVAAGGASPGGDAQQPHLRTWWDGRCPEAVLDHPVVNVSQADALAFCEWLTDEERGEGPLGDDERYVLPTFEQWKVFSRPATVPADAVMDRHWEEGGNQPTESVYSGTPSPRGLFGIWGNVFEWCRDTKRDDRCEFGLAVSGGWGTNRDWIEQGHIGVWRPYGRPMKDGGFRLCLLSGHAEDLHLSGE